MDLDIVYLSLGTAERLVDHDAGVRKSVPAIQNARTPQSSAQFATV